MDVLREAMNSVCYFYDIDFCDPEERQEAVAGEELADSVDIVVCKPPYYVIRQSEF